ncbi:MAG: caspase family protein [bacterium]|nr:caspase family protein [bacterium]
MACLFGQPAFADKRVAFVVGNSAYQNVVALTNPANDATAITEMFRKAAFDVVESRRDLKNTEMRRALRDFTEKARDADIAVIYYAGHGIEVDGTNYLVPVDAVLERDSDAYDEAIALDRILQAIEPAKQLRLVILDACRDNPFAKTMKRTVASRSLGRGLAGVEPSRPNTLIAFAAKGGSTAADGDSRNSPFTAALLRHLAKPGLELGKAFRLVRDDVMKATANRQEPFVYGSLGGNDVALVPAPAAPPAGDANADLRRDYELAERVGTREGWDSFIRANPSGFYADLAKAQRNKLAAEAARIAATEKARETEVERARLAAEGAKVAEQTKAAANARAAEEARLAAERKTQVEAEKLAAVERANRAEQQKQADESAKKAEAARLAAVTPAESRTDRAAPQDLPRLLQSELKRVGCKTGTIDGEWNASSRQALASFNAKAGTKFDVKFASIDALDAVRGKTERVCPLECERGSKASGDSCVKISCDDGYVLGSNGACQKRAERKPSVAQRRKPASGGRKCFVYGGASYCE